MGNAMLLAIVTGQRLGDISRMKFSDIWDDHLHIEQEKTGSKIAIPLALRCNAISWSLRDVVSRCRDNAVSPYMIHFFRTTSQAERGAQVKARTLTMNFSKARDTADINWGKERRQRSTNKDRFPNGFITLRDKHEGFTGA